jgi:hypothetical protein
MANWQTVSLVRDNENYITPDGKAFQQVHVKSTFARISYIAPSQIRHQH